MFRARTYGDRCNVVVVVVVVVVVWCSGCVCAWWRRETGDMGFSTFVQRELKWLRTLDLVFVSLRFPSSLLGSLDFGFIVAIGGVRWEGDPWGVCSFSLILSGVVTIRFSADCIGRCSDVFFFVRPSEIEMNFQILR